MQHFCIKLILYFKYLICTGYSDGLDHKPQDSSNHSTDIITHPYISGRLWVKILPYER